MYNYKLIIAYDGRRYAGWQIQPNATTIQAVVADAIQIITREKVKLIGSSRTDSEVHSLGQTANFRCSTLLDLLTTQRSLNGLLPSDIRIVDFSQVELSFHSQYDTKGKVYHYRLCCHPVLLPFDKGFAYHLRQPLNLEDMQQGASSFIGTHDFSSFANNANRGNAAQNPVRTLSRIDLVEENNGIIRLEFEGTGFLYKMVRNIVGTLIEIGKGKLSPTDIPHIIDARDRRQAPATAPGYGLWLIKVDY
ncbi:tRNA pseudouridine(38-40) synthase TruA [Simkania negevensis]|uniref:tRNA pseudouridine synthase A n=1 Tax=Simkania negevensis TaxID=83561 RepID=A0ABS3AR92_9BACT|nr:tRNA pseudouridine(38-40) synthase TruA [Simkania negevensis]